MKAFFDKRIFTTAMMATDKKDYREALRHIVIEYDAEKQVLTTMGTNTHIMIISKITVENNSTQPELTEFCKKVFEQGKGFLLPETVLKSKESLIEFELVDGRLLCNGGTVNIFDGIMPNWNAAVPKDNWTVAEHYCAFDPDLVKKIDKALGYKNKSIIDKIPFVSAAANADGASSEALSPHIWGTADEVGFNQLVLLMPRRTTAQ